MAADVRGGLWTTSRDDGFVVFLIGARINRLRSVRSWLPVVRAMGPMIAELAADPESGFLSGRAVFDPPRGVTSIQYWRSAEHLESYARDPNRRHQPAWRDFYQASNDGSVGIWHETHVVTQHEALYGHMPAFGLGRVSELARVGASTRSARSRRTKAAS